MNHSVTSTHLQVIQNQRYVNEHLRTIRNRLWGELILPTYRTLLCVHHLGFCVTKNKSPKKSKRLKHSLTMIAIGKDRAI